jgi:pimeloyl-ACP methyl ester carboxylesterase
MSRTRRSIRRGPQGTPVIPQWAAWAGDASVFVPQGYEPGYDYPLLVWLTDPEASFDLGRAMVRMSLRNFVAVEPARGEVAVWRAIERVRDRLSIHPRRIWLVGYRAGGTEAFRMACRHPDDFAGAVSLGGGFPLGEPVLGRLDQVRRMPLLLCSKAADVAADPATLDRTLRLFHACGGTLAVRIYQRGNELSRATLADVNRWLMDELCGKKASLQAHGAV